MLLALFLRSGHPSCEGEEVRHKAAKRGTAQRGPSVTKLQLACGQGWQGRKYTTAGIVGATHSTGLAAF